MRAFGAFLPFTSPFVAFTKHLYKQELKFGRIDPYDQMSPPNDTRLERISTSQ